MEKADGAVLVAYGVGVIGGLPQQSLEAEWKLFALTIRLAAVELDSSLRVLGKVIKVIVEGPGAAW